MHTYASLEKNRPRRSDGVFKLQTKHRRFGSRRADLSAPSRATNKLWARHFQPSSHARQTHCLLRSDGVLRRQPTEHGRLGPRLADRFAFDLPSAISGFRPSVFHLLSSVFGLLSSISGLLSPVFGLPSPFLGLPSPVSCLLSSVFGLLSPNFLLPSSASTS